MAKMMINHGILGCPSDKLRHAHISDRENGVEDFKYVRGEPSTNGL